MQSSGKSQLLNFDGHQNSIKNDICSHENSSTSFFPEKWNVLLLTESLVNVFKRGKLTVKSPPNVVDGFCDFNLNDV